MSAANSSSLFGKRMSRLGKLPITVPSGVTVSIENNIITVVGPKGTLTRSYRPQHVSVTKNEDGTVSVAPKSTPKSPALWGTYAAHVRNMISGVTDGFTRVLELEGVGYRAEVKGNELILNVGYSHPVAMPIPEGVTASVEKNVVTLTGYDLEVLSQFAANARKVRPPEPYKGKGIRYQGEYIIRKQGKKS